MTGLKKVFDSTFLLIVGMIGGALAGYFYWQQVGCNSGTCSITSSPVNSTLYGAMMGGLLLSLFKENPKERKATQ